GCWAPSPRTVTARSSPPTSSGTTPRSSTSPSSPCSPSSTGYAATAIGLVAAPATPSTRCAACRWRSRTHRRTPPAAGVTTGSAPTAAASGSPQTSGADAFAVGIDSRHGAVDFDGEDLVEPGEIEEPGHRPARGAQHQVPADVAQALEHGDEDAEPGRVDEVEPTHVEGDDERLVAAGQHLDHRLAQARCRVEVEHADHPRARAGAGNVDRDVEPDGLHAAVHRTQLALGNGAWACAGASMAIVSGPARGSSP